MIDFHWLLSSGVLEFLTHLHLSIAGFSSPRDKLGVIICYYVKDDVNILKASQEMPVGNLNNRLKGQRSDYAHSRALSVFSLLKTIEPSNYIMIFFQNGPPTEISCLHSQVISSTFEEVLRKIKNLARGSETCRIVRSFYNQWKKILFAFR